MTRNETRLLALVAAISASVIVLGTVVHLANNSLGTAQPPFVMAAAVDINAGFVVLAGLVCLAVVFAAPSLLNPRLPGWAFASTVGLLALAIGLSVNGARNGISGWSTVFDLSPSGSFEAKNEILGGTQALSYGPRFYLDHFAELSPAVPVNVAGHPPGLPLIVHWLGLETATRLAIFCIGALACIAPATYGLARSLEFEERQARIAALLAACSPALVLFGVTSADAVFALAGTLTAALLVNRRGTLRALGCVVLAAAALLSWLLLAIAAWAVLVLWRKRGAKGATLVGAGCAVAFVGVQGALAATTGWDPIGTLRATKQVYDSGISSSRPYWFWVLGAPTAFVVMAGIPITSGWLIACARRSTVALPLAVIIGVSALAGVTKAEVERIWLPFVPLACVAAAEIIDRVWLRWALGLMLAPALIISLAFGTVW